MKWLHLSLRLCQQAYNINKMRARVRASVGVRKGNSFSTGFQFSERFQYAVGIKVTTYLLLVSEFLFFALFFFCFWKDLSSLFPIFFFCTEKIRWMNERKKLKAFCWILAVLWIKQSLMANRKKYTLLRYATKNAFQVIEFPEWQSLVYK